MDARRGMIWILPTRGRPARCQEVLDACAATGMRSRAVCFIDGAAEPYANVRWPSNWSPVVLRDHHELAGVLRRALTEWPDEDAYGFLTDGVLPRTPGWDAALGRAAGSWRIAIANDNWHAGPASDANARLSGAIAFGGDLLRTLGWWVPEGFIHLYVDDVWEHLARRLGVWAFCPEVRVTNRHFANPRAPRPRDANTRRLFEGPLRSSSIALNQETVDVTNKDSAGRWRALLTDGGLRSASLSGAGVFTDSATEASVRAAFFGSGDTNFQFIVPSFGTFTGVFILTSIDYAGEHNGEATYTLSFESSGAITFAAV